jgi:hypothetical protein
MKSESPAAAFRREHLASAVRHRESGRRSPNWQWSGANWSIRFSDRHLP